MLLTFSDMVVHFSKFRAIKATTGDDGAWCRLPLLENAQCEGRLEREREGEREAGNCV